MIIIKYHLISEGKWGQYIYSMAFLILENQTGVTQSIYGFHHGCSPTSGNLSCTGQAP